MASFRREKFKPFGGPDGGDGGKGGDIYMLATDDEEDLRFFKHKTVFRAENGGRGGKNKRHGINAEDTTIKVPVGTAIYVKNVGQEAIIADLHNKGARVLVAKGGKGGMGNVHFATATRKAPTTFQPGEEGEELNVMLRLTLATDICIVGCPNSGKSALLAAISGAQPEIGHYVFTTTEPALGAVDDGVRSMVWAELPAVVEGSHKGKGLGNAFLRHAERSRVLVLLLDATSEDPAADLGKLLDELREYSPALASKRMLVAVNKKDLADNGRVQQIDEKLGGIGLPVLFISAASGEGLRELVAAAHKMALEKSTMESREGQPDRVFRPKPVDRRG